MRLGLLVRERVFLLEGRMEKDGDGSRFFWNSQEGAGEEERLRKAGKRRRKREK